MDSATLQGLFNKKAISPETLAMGMPQQADPGIVPISMNPAPPSPEQEQMAQSALASQPAPKDDFGNFVPDSAPAVASGSQLPTGQPPLQKVAAAPQRELAPQINPIAGTEAAFGMQEAGLQKEVDAGQKAAAAEASYYAETARQQQKLADEARVKEAERQKRMDDHMAKLDKSIQDYSKAEVDPNRFYKNMGTPQKILTGISLILGGFDKNGNQALKLIQDSVNQDIEAQKMDIQKKRGQFEMGQSLYGDMLKKFGDERAAESATRLATLNNIELKMKSQMARLKGPMAEAAGMKAFGEIQKQKQAVMSSFQNAMATAEAKQRLTGGGAGDVGADLERIPKEDRERYVKLPGVQGFAPTPERAKVLSQLGTELTSAKQGIDELSKIGRSLPFSENRAKANTLQKSLIGQLRVALTGPGAMSEGERELIESVIANPSEIFQANSKAKLDTLKSVIDKKMMAAAEAEGLKPLKVGAPVR